jgi:hypothetical protein
MRPAGAGDAAADRESNVPVAVSFEFRMMLTASVTSWSDGWPVTSGGRKPLDSLAIECKIGH